jgi:hypothetical protein
MFIFSDHLIAQQQQQRNLHTSVIKMAPSEESEYVAAMIRDLKSL